MIADDMVDLDLVDVPKIYAVTEALGDVGALDLDIACRLVWILARIMARSNIDAATGSTHTGISAAQVDVALADQNTIEDGDIPDAPQRKEPGICLGVGNSPQRHTRQIQGDAR